MRRPTQSTVLTLAVVCLAGTAAVVSAILVTSPLAAQELRRVLVTNFPEVFQVRGEVEVPEPIPASRLLSREEVLVSPVGRGETNHWVEAGRLPVDGYSHVVVSLVGEVRADVFREGEVGVVLLPEEEGVLEAFRRDGVLQLPLVVEAPASLGRRGHFAASGERVALAFPRYRAYLYNSTDKPVAADVHLYLSQ